MKCNAFELAGYINNILSQSSVTMRQIFLDWQQKLSIQAPNLFVVAPATKVFQCLISGQKTLDPLMPKLACIPEIIGFEPFFRLLGHELQLLNSQQSITFIEFFITQGLDNFLISIQSIDDAVDFESQVIDLFKGILNKNLQSYHATQPSTLLPKGETAPHKFFKPQNHETETAALNKNTFSNNV